MIDVAVGRLLVASLHQGIADVLPSRLEFYESWLNTAGLRDGRIGLAPLAAVLSFLRQEGQPYGLVSARAGAYAAEWTESGLPALERWLIHRVPPGLRPRLVMRVARRLIHDTYGGSSARAQWSKGRGSMDIQGSIFCSVRDRAEHPLCGFYGAAIAALMERFGIDVVVATSHCRATGGPECLLTVAVRGLESGG